MVETGKTGETEQRSLPVSHGNGQAELVRRTTMAMFEALDPAGIGAVPTAKVRGGLAQPVRRMNCMQAEAGLPVLTLLRPAAAQACRAETTSSPSGTAWGRAQRTLPPRSSWPALRKPLLPECMDCKQLAN